MDNLTKLVRQARWYVFGVLLLNSAIAALVTFILLKSDDSVSAEQLVAVLFVAMSVFGIVITLLITKHLMQPLKLIQAAILHVMPQGSNTPAPNLEQIKLGRELITGLASGVYQLASQQGQSKGTQSHHAQDVIQASSVVAHLPLPLFVFNKDLLVTNASSAGIVYANTSSDKLFGKPIFDQLDLEFSSDATLESWILDCQKNKVTDTAYWERVRVRPKGDNIPPKQCDIAAYYNRDNPSGTEFIVTLFDHTARYNQDDTAIDFVSLAVHELRTPLTMLRGHIEVFEEELTGKLTPELEGFMHKMHVSADQLTAFIGNILNVARISENQLSLRLSEANWSQELNKALDELALKANVHGKTIVREIPNNLPSVAIDKVSIYEVISNLIDNAIKYSDNSNKIIVKTAVDKEGLVTTTVQDFGVGIPLGVIPNLFQKFYRNHRTRTQIGGTGLGLYLCKALVNAHGGHIWVKSKEGEGSTFGFSVQPFASLADELKKGDNKDIVRNAHGWIKNHSMYRR